MNLKALLVGLVCLAAAAAAPAQAPAPEFTPESFRAHVAFLADDLLEGREAGTRGYDIAARYVATQFEALGLQPGARGQWTQPIEFVRYAHAGPATLAVNDRLFRHGEDILIRPAPEEAPLALEAPLVFAGFGLDLPARGFDDYAGLDAAGRIVVALDGYPPGVPSDVGAHLVQQKARMAAARGAVGLIVVRQSREGPVSAARYRAMAGRPVTAWVAPDGRPNAGDGLRFIAAMESAAAAALFEGASASLAAIAEQAERAGGRPRGFALSGTARIERPAAEMTRFASANVIALLPGTDPALAGEPVLLTAHLDGLGIAPGGEGDRIRNGAMDNATGVATLIEVARQMSRPGHRPRRPVLFAALTAEEKGLLGAEYLARHPVADGPIVAVVNLDMPVLTYDFQDVIAFGAEHSTLGDIVARAAGRLGVAVTPDPLPEQGLFTRSDHYEFVRVGVPAVFLMTGFAGEGRERFTSFLANEYHSVRDDMSLPFDWAAGARFARLNYLIAREIADAPRPPHWLAESFFAPSAAADEEAGQAASLSAANDS